MNILRKIISLFLITLAIFALGSTIQVKRTSNSYYNNRKIINVAVIFFTPEDPYTKEVIESLKEIENINENNVKYTFLNPQNNIAINTEVLDKALQSDYDLYILYLPDRTEDAVRFVIDKVSQRNKALILMNIPTEIVSKVSKIYNKVAFVTPDSRRAGIAQGNIIVDLWNRNKKALDKNNNDILEYVLLQGPNNDPQVVDRTKYVISTINNAGIKTQDLAIVNASWDRELAKTSIDNVLLRYGGNIDAIISNNDAMAIGAIEALQKYGYNKGDEFKNIAVVGIDGLQEAKDLIDKGIMAGTVIQDPKVQSELLYTIGVNLVNNLDPIENTNYQIVDGQIIIPFPYDTYVSKVEVK
ncbi:galactose ABC transporter substrate-binding protein [Clostridium sp. C2-6-12]|uniref:galactose ABC transporter substrate-binding protein n=1 Tax=Clostridium sp. C2-6-12 TaxID=2698832 RepID=UPI00136F811C|nr:galactose ABC transporter substrate-binding protein [Clostridium sp. C2-6-12]